MNLRKYIYGFCALAIGIMGFSQLAQAQESQSIVVKSASMHIDLLKPYVNVDTNHTGEGVRITRDKSSDYQLNFTLGKATGNFQAGDEIHLKVENVQSIILPSELIFDGKKIASIELVEHQAGSIERQSQDYENYSLDLGPTNGSFDYKITFNEAAKIYKEVEYRITQPKGIIKSYPFARKDYMERMRVSLGDKVIFEDHLKVKGWENSYNAQERYTGPMGSNHIIRDDAYRLGTNGELSGWGAITLILPGTEDLRKKSEGAHLEVSFPKNGPLEFKEISFRDGKDFKSVNLSDLQTGEKREVAITLDRTFRYSNTYNDYGMLMPSGTKETLFRGYLENKENEYLVYLDNVEMDMGSSTEIISYVAKVKEGIKSAHVDINDKRINHIEIMKSVTLKSGLHQSGFQILVPGRGESDYVHFVASQELIQAVLDIDQEPPTLVVEDREIQLFEPLDLLSLAKASDNKSTAEVRIVNQGNYTNTKVGTYEIVFEARDESGNKVSQPAKVYVVDKTPPTLSGENQRVPVHTEVYLDKLIQGEDNSKEPVVIKLIDNGDFDPHKVGNYPLTYEGVDGSGNRVTKTIQVEVYDDIAPLLMTKNKTIKVGEELDLSSLAKAMDNVDNEIIPMILSDGGFNANKVGTYEIIFEAVDSSGNKVQKSSMVYVIDDEAPRLETLNKVIEVHTEINLLELATATDNYDHEIEIKILDEGGFNHHQLGKYYIQFQAKDSQGNQRQATSLVEVVDTIPPVLKGEDIKLPLGEEIDLLTLVTLEDNYDPKPKLSLYQDGGFNPNQVGQYTLTYQGQDMSGNINFHSLEIEVVDQVSPVLENHDAIIDVFTPLNLLEPSLVKAVDNSGEEVMIQVEDDGGFDTHKLGVYEIKYIAKDRYGNEAKGQSQIQVLDRIKPVVDGEDRTIYVGDSIDLLSLVRIKDNYDQNPTLRILDNGGFDSSKLGEYQITFEGKDQSKNVTEKILRLKVVEKKDLDIGKEVSQKSKQKSPKTGDSFEIGLIISGFMMSLLGSIRLGIKKYS